MTRTVAEKRRVFRSMHESGCFVLPNPWDAGSARLLVHLGFEALATTSSGYAWTTGRADYSVTRDDVLHHLRTLAEAVDVPVNADFESGFATEPEGVARHAAMAAATGVASFSIEDRDIRKPSGLYDTPLAVERVRAARAAIDEACEEAGSAALLVGRTEGLLIDPRAVTAAIDRLVALAGAGADCLYAPGVTSKDDIAAMVRAVAPKPLNVLVLKPEMTLGEFRDLGVRRVSVGGALARVAWGAMLAAAQAMKGGSFGGLASAAPGKLLNETFRPLPR
jgi:2-methylisocitrate lyase-like PEP mutase family enzyme